MRIGEFLLPEFDLEMASTRKLLDCVPEEKFFWKLHEWLIGLPIMVM